MCGITGFADFNKRSEMEHLVSMTESLYHRGPDDKGCEYIQNASATVGLGFRRLAIIDLSSAGHQPMRNPADGSWIVFNGEIYNFQEIRSELEKLGHSFHSNSDTEVILKSYQQWGTECLARFIGMFALCIFDSAGNKLFLARDRAGVKPLYYHWNGGLFLFASELKALHSHPSFTKEIDIDALSLYFQLGYIPAPYSIFRNTFKLKPGNYLEIDLANGALSTKTYWDAVDAFNLPKADISFDEAVLKTEELMVSAFNYRMVSDVPVGVFLSGGYDSSCVTALLQKNSATRIRTFTIGFEESDFNEAVHARKVAEFLGTDHHEYYCTFREAMAIVPRLADIYDEPFGDSSAIPTTLVSQIARRDVTVALSADAGDELFAGYPRHVKNVNYLKRLQNFPELLGRIAASVIPSDTRSLVSASRTDKLKKVLTASDPVSKFKVINQVYTYNETRSLLRGVKSDLPTCFEEGGRISDRNDDLSKILLTEYKTYLVDDILQKVDRATMSASLEGREPFLDHRLLEWTATLPSAFKLKDGRQKILLKEIVHRHIPKELMERPKMGFGIPLVKWMRGDLRGLFEDVMSDESIEATGVLNTARIKEIRDTYLTGYLENFERLWLIFAFILWHRRWMSQRD